MYMPIVTPIQPESLGQSQPRAQFIEEPNGAVRMAVLPRTTEAETIIGAAALAGSNLGAIIDKQGASPGVTERANGIIQDLQLVAEDLRRRETSDKIYPDPVIITSDILPRIMNSMSGEVGPSRKMAETLMQDYYQARHQAIARTAINKNTAQN